MLYVYFLETVRSRQSHYLDEALKFIRSSVKGQVDQFVLLLQLKEL